MIEPSVIQPALREFCVSDGYRIRYRHWAPSAQASECRGIVIAMHGIQSHSGWYVYSSRRMAEAGFSVYFADRRGSGLNGAQRGHAAHALRLINDVRTLGQLARAECTEASGRQLPVILLGISWGGKTAAAAAAMYPEEFDRLALLYPGLEPRIRPTLWQRLQLNFARDFEILKRHIPIPLEAPSLFTADPAWQQFIANDPLALHTVTSSFLNAGRELDRIAATHAAKIHQPTLLMLAGDDAVIDNAQVRQRVNSFGSSHVTTLTYPGARHTLEFEPGREEIFDDLTEWLQYVAERAWRFGPEGRLF